MRETETRAVKRKAFVCGWPITHSRSPLLHGYWLRHYAIHGSYEPIAVEPGKLASLFERVLSGEFEGGNITIPHKEEALRLVDSADEAATLIGAVNTVYRQDGRLLGTNTDWSGFLGNLDAGVPGWESPGESRRLAAVIGAGGAARGIVYALLSRGFTKIAIINRTVDRARDLAGAFGHASADIEVCGFDDLSAIAGQCCLLVNTSSLGMTGQATMPDSVLADIAILPRNAVVNDIVYSPLVTPLLEVAENRGLRTVDGLGMLLHQAVPGFHKWFGMKPEVTPQLREVILSDLDRKWDRQT